MTTAPTFSAWPSYNEHEIAAVANTLASNKVNYWTGQQCREFEAAFAAWAGSAHAIALTNGTVALDLPLKCLGIGQGDEVIVTPRSFIASVSTVVNAGATPVFADVEADSGNISAATIERVITDRTRAVIPVHIGGWPCDMTAIMDLSNDRGMVVIEDCAQAHGAAIGNRMVGTFGHAAAWSFCQDKIMTTGGEGGMVTTDDPDLWNAMWSFKDHGKSWDTVYNKTHQPGFRWVHESFGTNWRMLEMQAAIGLLQLGYLPDWTARRTAIAQKIASTLAPYSDIVRCPLPDPSAVTHAFYRLYAYVRPEALATGWSRDRIVAEVNSAGAPLLHGTCSEIYLEKAFDGTHWRPADRLPNAKDLGETSLMFLVHPTLTDAEVEYCCEIVAKVLDAARR
jgi:dTDP-4-amino-4,6-dideoxygalactose transaminase